MDEKKTLDYEWEFGKEEIVLQVAAYHYGENLAVMMYHKAEGDLEAFGDLTVNLPAYSLEPNEAFISDFDSKNKLAFIKKYKMGKVLPWKGRSGYCEYAVVAFDLNRLSQYDKEGVERFCKARGIELPKEKTPKKQKKQMER